MSSCGAHGKFFCMDFDRQRGKRKRAKSTFGAQLEYNDQFGVHPQQALPHALLASVACRALMKVKYEEDYRVPRSPRCMNY
jgi:hypothetical protein